MYPDWPEAASDLMPLPPCDGPKLEPFDFQGPQKIEILQHVREGAHSHVFQLQKPSAKLTVVQFKFVDDDIWACLFNKEGSDNRGTLTAFANYMEPFNRECRAFGRLKESGCEHLATKCFGYLLLEDENERTMMNQLKDLDLDLEFVENVRSRFLGKDGRPPPIRGIIKEFGYPVGRLRNRTLRSMLKDMTQLQQLGIIGLDAAKRQFVSGKLSDFSLAITFPHPLTSPELNPHLTPEMISNMNWETFTTSLEDYHRFDLMVREWNHHNPRDRVSFCSLPGGGALLGQAV
ncbi:hypothetical protein ACHAPT_012467 [Fusarium lateritium]